jgi:hypothetical protein
VARRSKSDQLKFYRDCIDGSRRWRKHEGYDDLWKRMVKLYSGKQFPAALNGEDRIVVNVAFSTINVIAPSIAINNPKLSVWAQKMDDDDKAVIVEAVLNYWWRHFEVMPEVRLAVQDFLIIGHGWLKTGYRYVEEAHDRHPDALAADYTDAVDQADQYAVANPDQAGDLPTNEDIAASIPDTEMRVVEDRPFVERVSPLRRVRGSRGEDATRHARGSRSGSSARSRTSKRDERYDVRCPQQGGRRCRLRRAGPRTVARRPTTRQAGHRLGVLRPEERHHVRLRRGGRRLPGRPDPAAVQVRPPVHDAPQLRGARRVLPDG